MLPTSVFGELFAVIGSERDGSALSLVCVERVPELSELRVRVTNLVVVERPQMPNVPIGRARKLTDLQMVDLVAGERTLVVRIERGRAARPIWRRVRVMRVHEEEEEEEGLAPMRREPLRHAPRRLAAR